MKLIHWSQRVVKEVKGAHQGTKHYRGLGKPKGFWVSDESRGAYGWRSWCKAESFRPHSFKYEHEVKLVPNAKILYLRTAKAIDDFADEYIADSELNRRMAEIGQSVYEIDWKRVAKKYQGIIITPYQWQQRLGRHMWYYSWDCASGCIWNKRAIQSITVVKEHNAPKPPSWQERARDRRESMAMLKEATENLRKLV